MRHRAKHQARALRDYRTVLLFWRQMRVLVRKELTQLLRDRPLLFFIVYIFTVNIVMAGHESRELHNARILVYDGDHSLASRDLIHRFQEPYFKFAGMVANPKEGLRSLDKGDSVLFLDIPERFQETLRRGVQSAKVQMHVDTSKSIRGYLAASYAGGIVARFTQDWITEHGIARADATAPAISNSDRMWFNPTMNDAWFSAIAELLTMMSVACILLPASALVREKERGTIEQLMVSPLSPAGILLPKIVAMTIVMLGGTALALFGIMGPLFHVPMRGNLLLFFSLTALFSITTAGLGLAAATFARNSAQVGMLVLLVVMPIIVLSGTWTPQESLPPVLQWATLVSPLRHFIPIAYGILQRGEGVDTLWRPALAMACLGVALSTVSLLRFRRQFQ